MKAFVVKIPDYFPDVVSVRAGGSASKVRYDAFLAMRDANYDITFKDFLARVRVIHSPYHDYLAEQCKEAKSLGWHDDTFYYGCFDSRGLEDRQR